MSEHPVRILRREAIDAAQSMDYAKTLRDKAEARGQMYGLCKALSIIITPDAPAGYTTAGYTPIGQRGERVLRDFLGATKAVELLGPEN
jgi:hypothetical protein